MKALKVIGYLFILLLTIFWIMVTWRLLKYGGNHIAYNVQWNAFLAIPLMVMGLIIIYFHKQKTGLYWIFFGSVSIAIGFFLYEFNILLEYNDWIQKGMPSPPVWFL